MPNKIIAYADGASRGNPGPAAYGYLLTDAAGNELEAAGEAIGRATNNVAEYRGAIAALEAALRHQASDVELRLDSELIVRQIQGRYKVKNAALKPLHAELKTLSERIPAFSIRHVPRAQNAEADALANAALDDRI